MTGTTGLVWAVKDSLISYVEGLDDGTVEVGAPAHRAAAGFFFPPAEPGADPATAPAADGAPAVLQFLGAVRLTGHWGMLDVELRDPRVELADGHGTLFVRDRGSRDPGARVPFADLTVAGTTTEAGSAVVEAAATLSGHGRMLLGGQYAVGEALSPLRISEPARHG